ncbi:hypothetical protein L7F22_017834 [Adiantum nelumboides]|nr:hypothetical protein [Adiantum nelumboides]
MSHPCCPYCGSADGYITTTSPVSSSSRFVKECKSCGRIVEEYCCNVQDIFVERAEDIPLCIVTPDFKNNEKYHTPPIDDDPFESIGFITAFSTWSMELAPLYTSTTSSFCGYLAELERVLLNPVVSTSAGGVTTTTASTGSRSSTVDNLRAYFQILEVSSLLGLDRDISDHAVQLFRDCSAAGCMRNRNVEALATAALVQASREAKEARTLQEISTSANVSQKEIHRYMKILTDALKLSQPVNSNSISVYMPRFCSILDLEKSTQDLAAHIGDVVMNKSFCTRRNPISISAAAIYLSCQLEDKRRTQTEICKATALTEVTLRKVYKELLENIDDLLPANYTPVVPLEKAFPVAGSSSGRSLAFRGGLGSTIEPLSKASFVKPLSSMDSTNSSQINLGGKDANTLTAASVMEQLSLLNSSNKTSNCCSKRSMMVSNDETSGLVASPFKTAGAETSLMSARALMAKNALPDRAGPQQDAEALNISASHSTGLMHQPSVSFGKFFQDGFCSSVAAGGLPSPTARQAAENKGFSSSFESSRLHPGEFLHVAETDELSSFCPQVEGVAGKELAQDTVNDCVRIDLGRVQEMDNNSGATNCLASDCMAATTSYFSPVSQDVYKGLWDLNIAVPVPQDCIVSPHFPAQHEVEEGNIGILNLHIARHEVTPGNYSSLAVRNDNLEPLPLEGANCNSMQQVLHPAFWQSSLVSSAFSSSIDIADGENTNVTSNASKVTTLVENPVHSTSNLSGKVENRTLKPLPVSNLLEKLSRNISSKMTDSSKLDSAIVDQSYESRSYF